MKKLTTILITLMLICSLMSCSSKSADINPTYISNYKYKNYSCEKIKSEITKVNIELTKSSKQQDLDASLDAAGLVVSLVFWPALAMLIPIDDQTANVGRLKGELISLEELQLEKKCE